MDTVDQPGFDRRAVGDLRLELLLRDEPERTRRNATFAAVEEADQRLITAVHHLAEPKGLRAYATALAPYAELPKLSAQIHARSVEGE